MTISQDPSSTSPQPSSLRPLVDPFLSSRRDIFDIQAKERAMWKSRHAYYHSSLEEYCKLLIPPNCRVLEIGSGNGDLLAAAKPSFGVGVDISTEAVNIASQKYPDLHFVAGYAEHLPLNGAFDYIIL